MRTNLSQNDVTPDLIVAVYAYIAARAHAELLREDVDKVDRELLAENPLPNTAGHGHDKWITEPKYTYLCEDEDALERYYAERDARLRAAGLKPDGMPHDYCPALVAEHEQLKAERLLIKQAGQMLEIEDPEDLSNLLLCQPDGLAKRQEFIDLTASLVVTLNG